MYPFQFSTATDYSRAPFALLSLEGLPTRAFPMPSCWLCGKPAQRMAVEDNVLAGFVALNIFCHGNRERELLPRRFFTEEGWRYERRVAFGPKHATRVAVDPSSICFTVIVR
jgi:hypothetical protein